MREIKLSDIRLDGGTQNRVSIDQATVDQYVEAMKDGAIFPPLFCVFDGTKYWLVDGFHRYQCYLQRGDKIVSVDYKPGTQEEAQVLSFGVNGKHGRPRSREDKRKAVLAAFEHPHTKDLSDYAVAAKCEVSQPFVAGLRNPEKKKQQAENSQKHHQSKSEDLINYVDKPVDNSHDVLINYVDKPVNPVDNFSGGDQVGPDDAELKAGELAREKDIATMYKMMESDDALKTAVEENRRLNLLLAQLELRMNGLMNEKNEAIDMVKKLQKQIEKNK
jgi:hypothetical protein